MAEIAASNPFRVGLWLVVAPNATPGVECPACAQILQREKGRGVVVMMKTSSGSSSVLLVKK